MPATILGLDIGGANLKAADTTGRARSLPFALWKQPDRLAATLTEMLADWPAPLWAVTMTGELCDCFATKRDGVRHILDAVETAAQGRSVYVWSTAGTFCPLREARTDPLSVAAGNWLALATYAGRFVPHGPALLVDTGSTTTDIIPLRDGVPVPSGRNDPERLRSGELVYTGVRRTPVCAVLQTGLAAEWFATTHDVYLRLGEILSDAYDTDTADSRPATAEYAHARLARMLGGDAEITPKEDTFALALAVYEQQRHLIAQAMRRVAERLGAWPQQAIISGSGEFLARAAWGDFVAARERLPEPRSASTEPPSVLVELSRQLAPEVSHAACAYAVAVLLAEQRETA